MVLQALALTRDCVIGYSSVEVFNTTMAPDLLPAGEKERPCPDSSTVAAQQLNFSHLHFSLRLMSSGEDL